MSITNRNCFVGFLLFISLFSFQVFALGEPTAERLNQIEKVALALNKETLFQQVTFVSDPTFPGPARVRKIDQGYEILYNQTIMQTLSPPAQTFISYHELGHIYLGHEDMDPEKKVRVQIEMEADAFAAFLFRRFEAVDDKILTFIQFIESMTTTVPSGPDRGKLIRTVLFPNPQRPDSP